MTMAKTFTMAATTLGLALAPLIAAAPVLAQDADTATQSSADYSDEMLSAFVVAALDVADLRQTYQARLEAAPTPEEQQAIVDEANNEILGVVEGADGITVEKYIEIGQTAAADPALNERIIALMQDEMPAPE